MTPSLTAFTVWSQAKRQAEQTQKAAEDQRAKALAEAQAEASATLASAERTAAARLKDAEANAAQMVQEQEARAEQAAEASKQQVRTWSIKGEPLLFCASENDWLAIRDQVVEASTAQAVP